MAKKKIGLDYGHGENTYESGGGKGVVKNKKIYEEHHFNSAVGLIVKARLKELGFDVVEGQPAYGKDVSLALRTKKYNAEDCDLVVSIHANAGVKTAKGGCVFYWHTSSQAKAIAEDFMKHWKSTVKGVNQFGTGAIASKPNFWTNFHICRETKMNAILVECGFMTNDNDFEYIFGSKRTAFIPQVAETIVKTVCEAFGVTYKTTKKDAVKVPPVAPKSGYKIKKGDTFWSIAQAHKISVQELQKANPKVKSGSLQIGSYLVIPKAVKETPKGDQKTDSIVTYLNSIGVNSSFTNREKLAKKHGISNYKGTASQNTSLLKKIRGH